MFLVVFANKALVPTISSVQKGHLPTGHFSLLGNKGGTAIRLQCYDTTICFVNVHLYHVADATMRRTEDVRRILSDIVFDDADNIKEHDHVFFFGDLNYRVSLSRVELIQVAATTEEAKEMLDNGMTEKLLAKDQLTEVMATDMTFRGIREVYLILAILKAGTHRFPSNIQIRYRHHSIRHKVHPHLPLTTAKKTDVHPGPIASSGEAASLSKI
jgi:inositol-1,4,5-trisphosphate 5-phosphatase